MCVYLLCSIKLRKVNSHTRQFFVTRDRASTCYSILSPHKQIVMLKKTFAFETVTLLNVRIVFLTCAFLHLVLTAIVTLSIDTSIDEDPKVRAYSYVRWKLITCWFNLITLGYLPARLYADFRVTQGGEKSLLVTRLNHVTDVVMTSLLVPITLYSDIMFWCIYPMDPTFLAPPRVFYYLPNWAQHSLHTVSMFVVILDLILTPRERPKTLKPRIALLMTFSFIYIWMIYSNHRRGELVYPGLEQLSPFQMSCMTIFSLAFVLVVFQIQWTVIDLLWGTSGKRKKV